MPLRYDAPTPAQLKHDINRGRSRDKVPGFDPSAAPLGTDDEAAGTPCSPEALAQARAHEHRGPARPSPEAMEPGYTARVWIWVAVMVAVVGAVFLLV
jgi:hypothetical protein